MVSNCIQIFWSAFKNRSKEIALEIDNEKYSYQFLADKSRQIRSVVEKYSDLQFVRYENLCADPVREMKSICRILSLQYNENFLQKFGDYRLSGDSGRKKGLQAIRQPPRREIPDGLEDSLQKSEFYLKLVERLGY